MRKLPFVWISVVVLFCLFPSPAAVVLAQDPPPPDPAARVEQPGGSLGSNQQSRQAARWEGRDSLLGLSADGSASEAGAQAEVASQAGTDTFGYAKKAVPVAWTDISILLPPPVLRAGRQQRRAAD